MPNKNYLLFLAAMILGIGNFTESVAQDLKNSNSSPVYTYTIGANTFAGFIMKHDDRIGHLIQAHPVGFELFINQNTYGKKPWQRLYNFPDVGFSMAYFDFRVKELGKMVATTTYMDFYLKRGRKSEILLKIGAGLGFSTNPYHRETNNKNNVIGSAVSFTMQGRLGYNFKLNDRIKLTSSLTLTHFSNGAYKLPNKGINIITGNLGFSYLLIKNSSLDFQKRNVEGEKPEKPEKKLHYTFSIFSGVREIIPVGGKKYPFINTVLYVDKKLNQKSALLLGSDFFYSWAVKQEIKTARELPEGDTPDFKRVSLTVGHELFISKISLLTQLGVYIYKPFKSGQPIYQRYGLKYYFNKRLFSGLFLKAHYGVAENVEWGIGIRL